MGTVYKAKHAALNKSFAVKVLSSQAQKNEMAVRRFDQEAKAASTLDHQNLVKVSDYGITTTGAPYLVMDYLEGLSLADEIKKEGTVEVSRALNLALQICDGLAHAHSKGVVHRDLKPSNIILVASDDGKEKVKIVDFGIAKLVATTEEERQQLTQTGDIFGSPLYMSPEQCMGHKVDSRSDIYSLGCLTYEMLAGTPPLVGGNAIQTIFKHVHEEPAPFSKAFKKLNIPIGLEIVVSRMLSKNAEDRYQSIEDLKADLVRVQEGKPPGKLKQRSKLRVLWDNSYFRWLVFAVIALFIAGPFALYFVWYGLSNFTPLAPQWVQSVNQANQAFVKGDTQTAIGLVSAAIPEAPEEQRAGLYHVLGGYYTQAHDSSAARDAYRSAGKQYLWRKDNRNAADMFTFESRSDVSLFNYDDACAAAEEALALEEATFGKDNPILSKNLTELAIDYELAKRWDKAESTFSRVIQLELKEPKINHEAVADCYTRLGSVSYSKNNLEKAQEFNGLAASEYEKANGPMNNHTIQAIQMRAGILRELGRADEAQRLENTLPATEKK